jgi:predicted aspartyl protease
VIAGNSAGVDMMKEGGVLKVPIQINGAVSLKFAVDSGASGILIPKDVFLALMRAETIQKKDLLPDGVVTLADGSTVKTERFMLRSIKVGESSASDVEASVGGVGSELLLGQRFLSRFGEAKVDPKNRKLILTK